MALFDEMCFIHRKKAALRAAFLRLFREKYFFTGKAGEKINFISSCLRTRILRSLRTKISKKS